MLGLIRNVGLIRSFGLIRCDGDYGVRIGLCNVGMVSCCGDGSKGGSSNINIGFGCRIGRIIGEVGVLFRGRVGYC